LTSRARRFCFDQRRYPIPPVAPLPVVGEKAPLRKAAFHRAPQSISYFLSFLCFRSFALDARDGFLRFPVQNGELFFFLFFVFFSLFWVCLVGVFFFFFCVFFFCLLFVFLFFFFVCFFCGLWVSLVFFSVFFFFFFFFFFFWEFFLSPCGFIFL